MIALLLSLAFADSGCLVPPEGDSIAVVWVSKVRKTVGANAFIDVVPATALRTQDFQTVGELVHGVGLQKRKTNPRKPYKIAVFEVDPRILCRPIDGAAPGERVAGVPACESARTKGKSDGSGCMDELPVFRIRWSDAAARGFCILPAERFVDEGRQ